MRDEQKKKTGVLPAVHLQRRREGHSGLPRVSGGLGRQSHALESGGWSARYDAGDSLRPPGLSAHRPEQHSSGEAAAVRQSWLLSFFSFFPCSTGREAHRNFRLFVLLEKMSKTKNTEGSPSQSGYVAGIPNFCRFSELPSLPVVFVCFLFLPWDVAGM